MKNFAPKTGEPKSGEPRSSERKSGEAKPAAPRGSGARSGAQKAGTAKVSPASSSKPAAAKATPAPHRFIVLEGPIGVGKTSLASKLAASLGAELVLESADQNPFLERFYRQPRSGALPAQLYFLFQRAQQLVTLKQHDLFAPVRVADYLFDKDRLFARVTLEDEEFRLYEQVHAKLAIDAPAPDLVVYLQAPVDVLLDRIGRRGIRYEQYIERAYLERLNAAYARFFHEYDGAPLLIVNAAAIDPLHNESDYDELLAAIRRMHRGRLYYNPLRHAAL